MHEAAWLEVCLTVDGEMAEAVAEVLARFAPDGVAIETTGIAAGPLDEGHPSGPLRVCAYLPFDAGLEEKRRKLEEALWYLGRIRRLPEPQYRPVKETDWSQAWKAHYRPVDIGERLAIVPAWMEPPDPSRAVVRIDPGMAFGTGTHPTTQLCLELIEKWSADRAAAEYDLIDLGCGSGILAIAALKLGAGRALAVDLDPLAVEAARQNAQANGVSARLEVGQGSLDEIRVGEFSIRQASLVVANILAPVLVRLLEEGLADLLTPGGTAILSGILEEQVAGVQAAAEARGLRLVERNQSGDWAALAFGS